MAVVNNGGAFTAIIESLPAGNLTISAWVKFNAGTWSSFEAYAIILDAINDTWEAWVQYFAEPTNGTFRVWHSPAEHDYETGSPDTWFHIAIVNNGTNTIVYAREASEGSYTVINSQAQQTFTKLHLFRSESDADLPADASMGYARVHASGLTTTQLMAESNSATAVISAWADWPLSNLSNLGNDISGNARHLTVAGTGSATAELDDPVSAPVIEDIEGQADGVAEVVSLLEVTRPVAGTADGESVVTSDIEITRGLEGSALGEAFVNADIAITKLIATLVNGESAVSASVGIDTALSGEVAGESIVEAQPLITRGLEAAIAGESAVSSDLVVATDLASQADGATTVVASVAVGRDIGGTIEGLSDVLGSLDAAVPLDTLAGGESAVAGELGALRAIEGHTDGAAIVSGELPGGAKLLSAAIQTETGITGAIIGTFELLGAIAGESLVAAELGIAKAMSGQADGVSEVASTADRIRGIETSINGVALVVAALQATFNIEGQADGSSSVSGTTGALPEQLSAAIETEASVAGHIEVTKPLSSEVNGETLLSATLLATTTVQTAIAGETEVTGTLGAHLRLSTEVHGESVVTAALASVIVDIASQVTGEGTVVAALMRTIGIRSDVLGEADISGQLRTDYSVSAVADGLSSVLANLLVVNSDTTRLNTRAKGRARVAGSLTMVQFLTTREQYIAATFLTRQVKQ